MKLAAFYHIFFLFAMFSRLSTGGFVTAANTTEEEDYVDTPDWLTPCYTNSDCACNAFYCQDTSRCNRRCYCGRGGCDLSRCTDSCHCDGGDCDMTGCKWSWNCSCRGGNCKTVVNYGKIVLGVGCAIVAVLLLYKWWKDYQAKQSMEQNTYSPTQTQDQTAFPVPLKNEEPEFVVGAAPDKSAA